MNACRRYVGVDGCRAGWIAVACGPGDAEARVFERFCEVISAYGEPAVIAVDMPIGLPELVAHGGRGPEQSVRPLLGGRQSSVFSIPSRHAVEARDYLEACRLALATSNPPRKVSRQAFHLFGKIREIDALMTPALQRRVREVHPELAFWRLNGGRPLATPKKIRGKLNPEGLAERRGLLAANGMDRVFVSKKPPRGAAADDLLDACACSLIAQRIADGSAESFPARPKRDAKGLRVAIWA